MEGGNSATEAVMLQAAGLQRRLRDAIERCPSHATTRDGRKERELLVTVGVNLETLEMRIIDYHEYDGPLTDEKAKVLRGIDEARSELIRSAKDGMRCSTRGGALFRDILEFVEGSGEEEQDRSMPEFDVESPIGTPLEKDKLLKGAQATRWDSKEETPSLKSSFEASPTSVLSDDGVLEPTNNYGNGPIFKRQLFRDEDLEDERGVLGAYNRQNRPADSHPSELSRDEEVAPPKEHVEGKKKASVAGRILSWLVAGGVTWAAFTVFSMADKTKRPPGLWTARASSPKRSPPVPKRNVKRGAKPPTPATPKKATPAPAPKKASKEHPKVSVKERKGSKPQSPPRTTPVAPPPTPAYQPPVSTVKETRAVDSGPPLPAIMGPGPGSEETPDISVFLGRG